MSALRAKSGSTWGSVANMAQVYVNGIDCGVAWTYPYRVNITRAIKPGTNKLSIEVTNTWANRLIGDHAKPEKDRITWTNAPYRLEGNAGYDSPRLRCAGRPSLRLRRKEGKVNFFL
jgi:hypothetical protein